MSTRLNPNPFGHGQGTWDPFGWELRRLAEALSEPIEPAETTDDAFVRWLLPTDARGLPDARFRPLRDERILGRLDLHPNRWHAFAGETSSIFMSGFVLLARLSRWLLRAEHRSVDFVRFVDVAGLVEHARLGWWPPVETICRHARDIGREARLPGLPRGMRASLVAVEARLNLLVLGV